ncbi:Fpg/Nei family DNA glycosylase [Coraliomargarita parva]|uniref:Fpg/Nei family DNA glycosylase n=1 Tax=Coraliomargarita parva TaxID=3014050 RepID=UPI0022B4F243|nr:DNA-formamidopyrimidine glycosylase family protein [Coraliomargarita parva]
MLFMPELAEVEYYRRQWTVPDNCRVERVALHAAKRLFRDVDTDRLCSGLVGQTMTLSATHGKQMYFRFGDQYWIGVHLGMTGKLRMEGAGFLPGKHDHLVLYCEGGHTLVFSDPRMFGRVRFAVGNSEPDWIAGLPPEVLSEGFTYERMSEFLERRGKAPIKAVLLMQEMFPGIGNWMADEILWRARIAPGTRAGQIGSRYRRELYARIKEVCEDAMAVIAPDWATPPDRWLFNHRWQDGGTCPQTGALLVREEIGGRTTCWSPKWQRYRGRG